MQIGAGLSKQMLMCIYALSIFIPLEYIELVGCTAEDNPQRKLVGWLWLGISMVVFGYALVNVGRLLMSKKLRESPDRVYYYLSFLFPIFYCVFNITGVDYTNVNQESINQISAAAYFINERSDWGIYSFGFLGGTYPDRQYLLVGWPACVFGKTIFNLRIGYCLLYLISYSYLMSTLGRLWARHSKEGYLYTATCGVLIALGNFPLLWARMYEQTICPIAVTMLVFGGLIQYKDKPSPFAFLVITWCMGFFVGTYTPALAVFVLVFLVLFYQICRGEFAFIPTLIYCVTTVIVLRLNMDVLKYKFHWGDGDNTTLADFIFRYFVGFRGVFCEEALFPIPLTLGFLYVTYISILKRRWVYFLFLGWVFGTILLALSLRGWCWRPPAFDIHRAMVTIPPMAVIVMWLLSKENIDLRALCKIAFVFMVFTSLTLPFLRRAPREYIPDNYTDFDETAYYVADLVQEGHAIKKLYVEPPLELPIDELMAYFSPSSEIVRGAAPSGEHLPGVYVLKYINPTPENRITDWQRPSVHARPWVILVPE